MLFGCTFISRHVPADSAESINVTILDTDSLRLFLGAWDRQEAIYGATSDAVRAVWSRWLGDNCTAVWTVTNEAHCLLIGESSDVPESVRALALRLAAGLPIGADAPDDKPSKPEGGTPARLKPEPPRKPPGGAKVDPAVAAWLAGASKR